MEYMTYSVISSEEARRLLSSKCNPRQGRRRNNDDIGDVDVYEVVRLPPKKPRKRDRVPTESEQAVLLEIALEKDLKARGLRELQIRRAMRDYETIFVRHRARQLHALNPYAEARWASFLGEAIDTSEMEGPLWFVTIINDDWILGTYRVGPTQRDL